MIPLISNKKQAVTSTVRDIHISEGWKELNLQYERQLKYKKWWTSYFPWKEQIRDRKEVYWLNRGFLHS